MSFENCTAALAAVSRCCRVHPFYIELPHTLAWQALSAALRGSERLN
jgi:hypothetical protein